MKNYLFLIPALSMSNLYAIDIYNSANGQLTIPSVNVDGTNYNNVVINVGEVLKIGGSGGFALQNFGRTAFSRPLKFILEAVDTAQPPKKYTITINQTLDADTTFESKAANVVKWDFSLKIDNVITVPSYIIKNYFEKSSNFNQKIGEVSIDEYIVYGNIDNSSNPIKLRKINIGDFGFQNSAISYSDSSKKVINEVHVFQYRLAHSIDGKTAYACNFEYKFNPLNIIKAGRTEYFCFQVDNNGALLGGIDAILSVNDTILNFTGTVQFLN